MDNVGSQLLETEVMEANKSMKNNKEEWFDGEMAEFLKSFEQKAREESISLRSEIYEKGPWPINFKQVILISFLKKVNATECNDFRTIVLVSH